MSNYPDITLFYILVNNYKYSKKCNDNCEHRYCSHHLYEYYFKKDCNNVGYICNCKNYNCSKLHCGRLVNADNYYLARISFIPLQSEYETDSYYPLKRHPKEHPNEVIYEVKIEKYVKTNELSKTINEDISFGFDVSSDDYTSVQELIKYMNPDKYDITLVWNHHVKKSDIYAKRAIDRLVEINKNNVDKLRLQKDNPHFGKRRKKKYK